jgi:hypothetical protein
MPPTSEVPPVSALPPYGPGLMVPAMPAQPPKRRRIWWLAGIGAAVLVVICGGGAYALVRVGAASLNAGGAHASAGISASPTPEPLSMADYQTALGDVDKSMSQALHDIGAAHTAGGLATAANALKAAAESSRARLTDLTPPTTVASAHQAYLQSFTKFATFTDDVVGLALRHEVCMGSSAMTVLGNDTSTASLRSAVTDLATAVSPLTIGAWVPAQATLQKRQLANGTYVKKGTRNGMGQLKIDNKNGTVDTLVTVTPAGAKAASFSVYLRAGSSFTVTGIKDNTYDIYLASGMDWDPAGPGFSRECGFNKFDESSKFTTTSRTYTVWSITLSMSSGGNASASEVDPDTFPQ